MILLKSMEFAIGAFLVAFVMWQIISPLLSGKKPFPAFRGKKKEVKRAE